MKNFLFIPLLLIVVQISSCKDDDDPIGPDTNPYIAVFSEQFNEVSDWKYYEQEYDSVNQTSDYIEKSFSFSNGMAELNAVQNNDCDRVVLTKEISNTQEIIDHIESDSVFITFNLDENELGASGWSSIVLALDSHFLEFEFYHIDEPTEYVLKIANWQMYDLFTVGDADANLQFEYSNNPTALGTDQLMIRADACGGDLYASAKIVVDKVVMVVSN